MNRTSQLKMVHEREYVAKVEVQLNETDDEWSPFLSLRDAEKLDQVRNALRLGDVARASQWARVYRLMPVAV